MGGRFSGGPFVLVSGNLFFDDYLAVSAAVCADLASCL